jgi:transcriptional regulator with XRE-family HTH domain
MTKHGLFRAVDKAGAFDYCMTHKELDKLMGMNLQRLRLGERMTQEQLAERLEVSSRVLQRWEAGEKGIGKAVLLKLCRIFNVKSYAFHTDGKMPYLTNTRERKIVNKYREAEELGVDDLIAAHCDVVIEWAKKKQHRRQESMDIFVNHPEAIQTAEKEMPASNKRPASRNRRDDNRRPQ